MDNQMNDRDRLYLTAMNAGLNILSDDYCAKLLAWVYVYGGDNEEVVYNPELNSAIKYAQRRANLMGGEVPDAHICERINFYIREIDTTTDREYSIRRRAKWILGER